MESRVPSWVKMKRVLALVMLFKSKLLSKISEGKTCLNSESNGLIDVQMIEEVKKFLSEWFKGDQSEQKSKPLETMEKINTLKEKALYMLCK